MTALHPRLADPRELEALRSAWGAGVHLRIADALEPGLAAEIAAAAAALPFTAMHDPAHRRVDWVCQIAMPPEPDPQHPPCFGRLIELADVELPALIAELTGDALEPAEPDRIELRRYRKGSRVDRGGPSHDAIDGLLWLTGARWPREVGGWIEWSDGVTEPGWDCLDLFSGGYRVELVTRPVDSLAVAFTHRAAR